MNNEIKLAIILKGLNYVMSDKLGLFFIGLLGKAGFISN